MHWNMSPKGNTHKHTIRVFQRNSNSRQQKIFTHSIQLFRIHTRITFKTLLSNRKPRCFLSFNLSNGQSLFESSTHRFRLQINTHQFCPDRTIALTKQLQLTKLSKLGLVSFGLITHNVALSVYRKPADNKAAKQMLHFAK